ncbi:MAG: hypothetical protein IPI06_15965 [Gammaproteobacteria bacterium]|nr:hypothetical protein [Gammaproteobacteria bacterium]
MLHGAILRTATAHAIRRIDTPRAERLEGVIATVITGEDVHPSTNPSGGFPEGGPGRTASRRTRCTTSSEPICPPWRRSAIYEDPLELIEVELEPLVPVIADTLEAMKPGSPLVIEALGSNVVLQKQFTWGPVAGRPSQRRTASSKTSFPPAALWAQMEPSGLHLPVGRGDRHAQCARGHHSPLL